jgi:hypothetical protein
VLLFIILRAQISFSSKYPLMHTAQQTKTFLNHEKSHLSAFHTRKNFLLLAHVCKIKTKSKLHIFLCPKCLFHHLLGVTASFRFWNAPLTASPVCNPPPHLHKLRLSEPKLQTKLFFFLNYILPCPNDIENSINKIYCTYPYTNTVPAAQSRR